MAHSSHQWMILFCFSTHRGRAKTPMSRKQIQRQAVWQEAIIDSDLRLCLRRRSENCAVDGSKSRELFVRLNLTTSSQIFVNVKNHIGLAVHSMLTVLDDQWFMCRRGEAEQILNWHQEKKETKTEAERDKKGWKMRALRWRQKGFIYKTADRLSGEVATGELKSKLTGK